MLFSLFHLGVTNRLTSTPRDGLWPSNTNHLLEREKSNTEYQLEGEKGDCWCCSLGLVTEKMISTSAELEGIKTSNVIPFQSMWAVLGFCEAPCVITG